MSAEEVIAKHKACGTTPMFSGYGVFENLLDSGRIGTNSIIRIGNGTSVDDHYCVTEGRKLKYLPVGDQIGSGEFDPEVILSKEHTTYGWMVDRMLPGK